LAPVCDDQTTADGADDEICFTTQLPTTHRRRFAAAHARVPAGICARTATTRLNSRSWHPLMPRPSHPSGCRDLVYSLVRAGRLGTVVDVPLWHRPQIRIRERPARRVLDHQQTPLPRCPDVPMFLVRRGYVVRTTINNHSGELQPMHLQQRGMRLDG